MGSRQKPSIQIQNNQGNEKILKDILDNVKTLVQMKEAENRDEDIVSEWKTFGKLIDRIIFLICFVVLIILLASFLD